MLIAYSRRAMLSTEGGPRGSARWPDTACISTKKNGNVPIFLVKRDAVFRQRLPIKKGPVYAYKDQHGNDIEIKFDHEYLVWGVWRLVYPSRVVLRSGRAPSRSFVFRVADRLRA